MLTQSTAIGIGLSAIWTQDTDSGVLPEPFYVITQDGATLIDQDDNFIILQ